jgi:peptide/nickel transport system substrate-binding protein
MMRRTGMRSIFGAVLLSLLAVLQTLPAAAAKDVLTVDLGSEPSSLDPQVQWNPDSYYVYRNIFDNLITRDDKGEIVPEVATSWKYLSDTEIEFTVRGDITFHDGTRLTAEDVAYSVKRITDPKFASPQLGQFNKIVDAKATSPTTILLKTDGPYPALLAQLVKLSIVPKHVVEALGNDAFNLKPLGSGPYVFENWQRGVAVTLRRNDAYWGRKGPFATALFRPVPDAATRLADLQAGTADLAIGLDSDLAAQLKGSARAKVASVLTERVAYLRLNTKKPPFDNPEIRKAFAYAIDRNGLVDGILGGYGKLVPEMLTPAHFGWIEGIKQLPYDAGKAKAIVAGAGEVGKQEIEFATSPAYDQRIVQAVQQMLSEAGLNVRIAMTDNATFLKRAQSGPESGPTMSFGRWSCACQDADGVLFPLLHQSSGWSFYRNGEADKLLEEARATLDEKRRLADYGRLHEIVAKEVPLLPLYQDAGIYGAAKALQWQPTPNESLFLNRMDWKE